MTSNLMRTKLKNLNLQRILDDQSVLVHTECPKKSTLVLKFPERLSTNHWKQLNEFIKLTKIFFKNQYN